jgi:ABC-type phosphate transport system substrate-binding protein
MARRVAIVVAVAAVWLGAIAAPRADRDDLIVIVHPDNPATSVDRDFLRDAFLKKRTEWGPQQTIRPIDLPASSARDRFTQDVLKKSSTQLRSYWNQQIFSGKGVPPPTAKSIAAAIAYVLANPGAVAYLPADADPGRAKVLRLR